MNLRRLTLANPMAAFSIVAHEAWDHKYSDGENDDGANNEGGHSSSQRSRRRYGVSKIIFDIKRYCIIIIFIIKQTTHND
jgi:hypothetical protein